MALLKSYGVPFLIAFVAVIAALFVDRRYISGN